MTTPWHDDDSFWQIFGPAIFPESIFSAAQGEIEAVLRLTGIAPGTRVLDQCCGPGRHSLELARRGFTVTGVDLTETYLAEARRRAEREGLKLELLREDMRRFVREKNFDLALNLFTSFSYFTDPAEDRRVVENLYQSLRPGGMLVMELMGREILARMFQVRDWRQLEDGSFLLEERQVTEHWSWMRNRWILVRNGQVHERVVQHRLYTASDLGSLLASCGFVDVELYGSLSGEPYDHHARRLVAVAKRPLVERSLLPAV